ncbi:MAG TPA: adenylate/guanylate cyclase domain-containing protein, partial [Povalibacter sp.]|nr:adenylate/guanylate cyclase domain-containing protein [Povalibacter sp.]
MIPARILCSACGFTNQSGARYCSGCARPLARTDGGGYGISLAAVQTPHHLAERILASRGALGGERKLVTVMFADVQGSLEIIGGRDAEQAQAILDALLRAMVDAVHRYEGTVNQILGDGIMAIFGAPIAHENHPELAVRAALAMHKEMEEYNKRL